MDGCQRGLSGHNHDKTPPMTKKILYAILALGLLAPAGAALTWHPANDPSAGCNSETLDQAHAASPAEQEQQGQAFAAWHQVWPTSLGIRH